MNTIENAVDTVFSGVTITPPYGCEHYLRRCKLRAPCCNKIVSCRFCHDDEVGMEHKMNKSDVQSIICTTCNEEQPVSQYCIKCNTCFGSYYCKTCRLFDDIDKEQYHCEKCGICRQYKSSSFHCDACNICLCVALKGDHVCTDKKDINCPVCMENIFYSTTGSCQLKCGHSVHYVCLMNLLETANRCPICQKSIVHLPEMNEMMDQEVAATPMPDEYKDKVVGILCNDCSKKSEVKFHIIGMKCTFCGSYNTRQV